MVDNEKTESKVVHISRSVSPERAEISPMVKLRHQRSKKLYQDLSLTEGEYVIASIKRHPIGLFLPASVGLIVTALGFMGIFNADFILEQFFDIKAYETSANYVVMLSLALVLLATLGTYVSYSVYNSNRFYLTNESVIQVMQTSLFAKHVQLVSLASIEDCSYKQTNIIESFFNYGTLRLSTIGDETTYSFPYTPDPKRKAELLNNAVEAFKNGRAITEIDEE